MFLATVLPVGALSQQQHEVVWKNLQRAIHMGKLMHFELEGEDPNLAFWICDTVEHPVPVDIGDLFIVAHSNPFRQTIEQWINEAYEIHSEIEATHDILAAFLKTVKHPKWVEVEWPELLPFIGRFPKHMMKQAEKRPAAMSIYTVTPHLRSGITDVLTKCLLLEDAEINAWVAYADSNTGRGGYP